MDYLGKEKPTSGKAERGALRVSVSYCLSATTRSRSCVPLSSRTLLPVEEMTLPLVEFAPWLASERLLSPNTPVLVELSVLLRDPAPAWVTELTVLLAPALALLSVAPAAPVAEPAVEPTVLSKPPPVVRAEPAALPVVDSMASVSVEAGV